MNLTRQNVDLTMFVLLALVLIAGMVFTGCSNNPAAIPGAVAAATVLVVAIEPDTCSEVPFDEIDAAIAVFENSYVTVKAVCAEPAPVE